MKNLDILAIGDTVIDAFIRLQDARIECDENKSHCRLSIEYGAKIPYESVTICNAVGNAANASVSAARLGLASGLLTYLGDDQNGKDCFASLTSNGVVTDFVRTEAGKKTNYHYVLWYDVDRTILVKHEKFTYTLGDIGEPQWIYLSSLGENSQHLYGEIAEYLAQHPNIKLAFQPGVFDIKLGTEKLKDIYKETNAICVNVEEAQTILGETSRDLKVLLNGLSKLGPQKVFITDGFDGAYAHDNETGEYLFIPVYPHTPFERTGAGDAFFSTVIATLAQGGSLTTALTRGPINSQSVVQQIGAQAGLLTAEKMQEFLDKAPAEYTVKEI